MGLFNFLTILYLPAVCLLGFESVQTRDMLWCYTVLFHTPIVCFLCSSFTIIAICILLQSKTSSNKRPMLVELHSFPGFDRQEITALPFPIKAENILETVTEAQIDLKKKVSMFVQLTLLRAYLVWNFKSNICFNACKCCLNGLANWHAICNAL